MIYRSRPEDAKPIGWGRIEGRWFTLAPLVDVSTPDGLTASLGCPGDAEKALAVFGARLPTSDEIALLNERGYRIRPVFLPTRAMMPPRAPGEDDHAYAVRCYAPMASLEWAQIHNARCKAQLDAWDGVTPIANFGKHPYRNGLTAPPPGRCYLRGWWQDLDPVRVPGALRGYFTQEGVPDGTPGPHADGQFDYGTTVVGVFDGDTPPPFDTIAIALFTGQLQRAA